jgi:hypothetical protein
LDEYVNEGVRGLIAFMNKGIFLWLLCFVGFVTGPGRIKRWSAPGGFSLSLELRYLIDEMEFNGKEGMAR